MTITCKAKRVVKTEPYPSNLLSTYIKFELTSEIHYNLLLPDTLFYKHLQLQSNKAMAEEGAGKLINTHDGASSSSSTTPQGSEYEVFLSFRGEDTGLNFTDHLYCNLKAAGIRTFRDNEGLHIGEEIGPDLLKAIEQSTISIPIFSEGYASSKWCLIELTHMVKRMKSNNGRHTICPVFYGVTPANVKHQTGSFEEAFLKHTKDEVDARTIQEWKDALKEVAELKGWEKDKIKDGHEGELIKIIVTELCVKLKKSNVSLPDNLVGMDHHIEEMTKLLDISSGNGVRIVGILGMGGLGKTTIAKYMYNQLCDHFQHQCSFLEDVRENVVRKGIAELQEQLVSDVLKRPADEISVHISNAFRDKKVLIVLDDVKDRLQFDEIIRSRDWFGSGSRIIVTSRSQDVSVEFEVDHIYRPTGMDDDNSLLLFSQHAFKSSQPSEDYRGISKQLAESAAGLPLSLRVIGSMLFKKEKPIWEETLEKLKDIPPDKVVERLKISYDALEKVQQQIFLDIACHFIGEDKTLPFYMWAACKFFPETGIDDLVCLSLITIEKIDNEFDLSSRKSIFRMHDQLRDLGRYIVYEENPSAVEKRSRLWSHQEAIDTLKNQLGTKQVLTLQISFGGPPHCFSNLDFKELTKLRYLHVPRAHLKGDFNSLLCELRWLKSRSMTFTSFFPAKLVVLDLSDSDIEDGWESSIESEAATNLKVLNLSECDRLTKTPDFSKFKNLERLILQGCENLTKIGSSVKHLKRLTYLNADDCPRLTKLPDSIGLLTQLQCISLHDCNLLEKIPESFGDLKSLIELNISDTGIRKFSPEDVGKMEKLEVLNCSRCESLEGALPSGIGRLSSLRVLDLSFTKVDTLPDDVRNLGNLRKFKLHHSKVKKLPGVGIECLQKLEVLNCSRCESLEGALPSGIGTLSSLRVLDLSVTKVDTLPDDVRNLGNLRKLHLYCSNVKKLPGVGIECLQKLEELNCYWCSSLEGEVPEEIWSLSSLRLLNLNGTKLTGALPEDISGMSRLETLDLRFCEKLRFPTQGLKLPISLNELVLPLTKTALDSDSLRSLVNLRHLEFEGNAGCCCEPEGGLVDHHDNNNNNGGTPLLPTIIDMPSNLESLKLRGYGDHKKIKSCRLLPVMKFDSSSRLDTLGIGGFKDALLLIGLSNCQMLRELRIEDWNKIREIPGFGNSLGSSLVSIDIWCCYSLEVLPNFSTLKRLKYLAIGWCPKLREIKGLEEVLSSLKELTIKYCPLLKEDELHPDLFNSKTLKITFERQNNLTVDPTIKRRRKN